MQTIQRVSPIVARVLLGLAFTVFGLNGFLGFLPAQSHGGAGGEFLGALAAAGYMFPLIKGTELLGGLLLLGNRFVPLALALLAPVLVNIVAFHLFLEPASIGIAALLLGLELFLAWSYRDAFRSMLRARTETPVKARPRAVATEPSRLPA